MDTVTELISTIEDGPGTVNERLSPGGPGPEGQPDTAHEILSGSQPEKVAEPEAELEAEPAPKPHRARAKGKA